VCKDYEDINLGVFVRTRDEVKQPRTVFFPLHERLRALTRPDFGKLTQRFENALLLPNQTKHSKIQN